MYSKYKENGNLQIQNSKEVISLFMSLGLDIFTLTDVDGNIYLVDGEFKNQHLFNGKSTIFSWNNESSRVCVCTRVVWFDGHNHDKGLFIQGNDRFTLYANKVDDLKYVLDETTKKINKYVFGEYNKEIEKQLAVLD